MTAFAIIGAGAIGGYYGSRLAAAGHDVYFLFRSDAEYVREHGLVVKSPDGDLHLTEINSHEDWHEIPPVDVVIVSVKATANDDVAGRVAAILKPGGTVLLIQNGVNAEGAFAAALPDDATVVGATAFISAERTDRNVVEHFANGQITIGEYAPDYGVAGITARLEQLSQEFIAAGIPVQVEADLLAARWGKLLWNIPFNALCVVLQATTTELISNSETLALVKTMMNETIGIAAADGKVIPVEFVEMLLEGTRQMDPYSPSMKVDFDAGRQLELEALLGAPLRRAETNGAAAPTISAVYRQLRFIDERIANSN